MKVLSIMYRAALQFGEHVPVIQTLLNHTGQSRHCDFHGKDRMEANARLHARGKFHFQALISTISCYQKEKRI